MNTRIQVDLVHEHIEVAAGSPLSISHRDDPPLFRNLVRNTDI